MRRIPEPFLLSNRPGVAMRTHLTNSVLASKVRRSLRRVPVWAWRLLMHSVSSSERSRFNKDPITGVEYTFDIDFVGEGHRYQLLDVITPSSAGDGSPALPVYVYFHGGGWTSGDKAALTKYCASQAEAGMVVVNVNYRVAPEFHMAHVLDDANAAMNWVQRNISRFGGDPHRLVLGGDSAGGQIAALLTAATFRPELAGHYNLRPAVGVKDIKGLVQHCSVVDFSVFFEKGFVLSLNFVRMLVPGRAARAPKPGRHERLRRAARFLSPIEWLDSRHPPVLVTTSERDYFYTANLNYIKRLREHSVPVDALVYDWASTNTEHTWQQNYRYPESQEVYRRLHAFVDRVAG